MTAGALQEHLAELGRRRGLDAVGFCSADVFDDVRTALHERKDAGLHADMQFTYRNPDRATDPARSLPGARSIVVGARSYRRTAAEPDDTPAGQARIAEYVWEPHYEHLRQALDAIAGELRAAGHRTRVLVDDNALVDRAAAHRAGIGWWGKNSNLLIPERGSRFVLGSVVTDADLGPDQEPVSDQCGPCRRCIDACPTGAIVADGVIDANRCLAWLVQSAEPFPREFRAALGDRIYGCDDCQTTCPPNVLTDRRSEAPVTVGSAWAEVEGLLSLDDSALLERFGAWYIPKREARYLRRNALIVLGNTADPSHPRVRALLERYVASPDPVERGHAVWAAAQLGHDDLVDVVVADADPFVRDEYLASTRSR
ncbi:MAG: tRNA epoxyqueuosine(34) reductase QueG [Acidimicrobiales bacterium]